MADEKEKDLVVDGMARREVGIMLRRDMPIVEIRAIDEKARTVDLSFSSETPVTRWYGQEILSHDDGAVDLSRLQEMGVGLFNHDRGYVLGKVLSSELDVEAKKCRAVLQFDEDQWSEYVYSKVRSGTLKGVSCGYMVDSWEEVMPGKMSSNGRFAGPCDIALRWMPYEVSIVSVPADASVGVGRSALGPEGTGLPGGDNRRLETPPANVTTDLPAGSAEVRAGEAAPENTRGEVKTVGEDKTITTAATEQERQAAIEAERKAGIEAERKRASEITMLCREFEIDPSEHIEKGRSIDETRAAVLKVVAERNKPVTGGADVHIKVEATDKFRAAATHAMLMRAGMDLKRAGIEKPADGAADIRHMSIRSMMEEHLRLIGVHDAARMTPEQILQRALSPDSGFSSVLDNTIGHSMLVGHSEAQTTFQYFVRIGNNPNFKATPKFRTSEASEPKKVGQNGELEWSEMADEGVSTKIDTYGERWGFTRQAMINDDLGVLTDTPRKYAMACQRKKNRDVYAILNANAAIYDAKQLFVADHGNIAAVAAKPSVGAFSLGRAAMKKQKGLKGEASLNIQPRILLTGVDIETVAAQIVRSSADPAFANANVVNPFQGELELHSDAMITNTIGWFMLADPNAFDTIELTTLNGKTVPTIETRVSGDCLGMEFWLYDDWGVTVLDYRGMYYNAGAA